MATACTRPCADRSRGPVRPVESHARWRARSDLTRATIVAVILPTTVRSDAAERPVWRDERSGSYNWDSCCHKTSFSGFSGLGFKRIVR